MKIYAYLALIGLASCFDASTAYDVTTDPDTKYITFMPKGDNAHEETLLYFHGGGGSAKGAYYNTQGLKESQIAPLTTKVVILNAPVAWSDYSFGWWNDVPKGSGYTDDLGNDIVAI